MDSTSEVLFYLKNYKTIAVKDAKELSRATN